MSLDIRHARKLHRSGRAWNPEQSFRTVSFGSTAKARSLLEAALRQDPRGLDNNFFYADFLNDEGHPAEAKTFALRGLAAPVNTARPVWDAGRRAEMRTLLAKINIKLKA